MTVPPISSRTACYHRGLTRQRPGQQQRGGRPGGGAQQQPGGGSGSSGGRAPPKKLRARRNEEIRASEVRAILPDGGNQVSARSVTGADRGSVCCGLLLYTDVWPVETCRWRVAGG